MTILTLNKKQLEKEIGKIDEKLESQITMFGTTIEEVTEDEVSIEVFPNRPDLLSFQGFIRSFKQYLGKSKPSKFKINKPEKNYQVKIDKSVKKVRPHTVCAIVKNLKLTEEKIKDIIDIQEKLHITLGRKRKKLAIGVYPLEKIQLPITYTAKKPEEIKFQPLEFPKEITGRQILSKHPTGREYADLLKDCELFPIFIDANNEVLSMPPIINSHKTGKISEKTKEVFIECSGFELPALEKTLNIIITALSDMGGKVYQMEIIDNKKSLTPNLENQPQPFEVKDINKTLGLELKEKEISKLLNKMGIEVSKSNALIPPYRTDILHWIDLTEEIAIAYGYENFKPELPKISTIGQEDPTSILKKKISEVLIGLGLQEISTFHLSTKEKQFKNLLIKEHKDLIEVLDSKTENNILRTSLLSHSISTLSENTDSEYPQKIFELGKVFSEDDSTETKIKETEKLCISLVNEKANFTEIKQTLDYLMRMFNKEYKIKETENPSFIPGRCGEILINKKPIGILGEINPTVLKNNKIKMPIASLELEIDSLND